MFVQGASANVTCTALAYPPPTFYWKRNGKVIPISEKVIYDDKGLLMFTELDKDDAGQYECIATNVAGTGSAVVSLQYIGKYYNCAIDSLNGQSLSHSLNVGCN